MAEYLNTEDGQEGDDGEKDSEELHVARAVSVAAVRSQIVLSSQIQSHRVLH
jgi:hypothetical protein